jgi:hypothetical protein
MLGSADGSGWALRDDLADDQPVEEGTDGGKVLLDRGCGERLVGTLLEQLDVPGDVDRLDVLEGDSLGFAPAEELGHGLGVGGACVLVSDVGREELEEPLGGVVAEFGDDRRDGEAVGTRSVRDLGGHAVGLHSRKSESINRRFLRMLDSCGNCVRFSGKREFTSIRSRRRGSIFRVGLASGGTRRRPKPTGEARRWDWVTCSGSSACRRCS